MKKFLKISLSLLLVFVLSAPLPTPLNITQPSVVYAASKAPNVSVDKVTLYVGYKTYQIKVNNLSSSASVTFKSSNSKIAKVSASGIITPIKKGSANVTITMSQNGNHYTDKIKVTVDNSHIKFTSKKTSLNVGNSYTYKAKAYGTSSKITWSVSKKSVAKINSTTGKLTALKEGEVDVIATAGNITSNITVKISAGRIHADKTDITCYDEQIIYITMDDMDDDETINYQVDDTDIVSCQWGDWDGDTLPLLISPNKVGKTKIFVFSSKTNDEIVINVNVVEEPDDRDKNAKKLTAEQVYKKCAPATVEVRVSTPDGDFLGSGFFIYSGILITNYHVIEGATKIQVVTYDNKTYDAKVIYGYDEDYDIAVIGIDAVTEHLTLNKGDISVGETVYALGSPEGLTGSLSEGIVSSSSRVSDGVEYIQVTAPMSHGNSGGPLLNAYGEVIGINTFKYDGENLNFAVNVYQYLKLNFNNKITANEFYETNKSTTTNTSDSDTLYEDSSKSSNYSTAQYVKSNVLVYGTLEVSNNVDGYHFTLSQSGKVLGLLSTSSTSDYNYVDFYIYNSNKELVCKSTDYTTDDGNTYRALVANSLPAGDYYVIVYAKEDNNSKSRDYSFMLQY